MRPLHVLACSRALASWLRRKGVVAVNQAVRSHLLRYHVRVRSGSLDSCGSFGPSTRLPNVMGTRVLWMSCRDHGCDQVSRVRPDESANPVVVWLGLVSRVVRSSWSFSTLVCIQTPLFGPVVATSWPTLGSSLVLIRLVRIGTPVTLTFIVNTAILMGSLSRCHSLSHGICCWTPSAPDAALPLACRQPCCTKWTCGISCTI